MLKVNKDDLTISLTRGDSGVIDVTARDGDGLYKFKNGDKVVLRVSEAKDAGTPVRVIYGFISEEDDTLAQIALSEEQTKFGDPISKPADYWYEISLENDGGTQTLIGYDEDGPKILRLFPEIGE